VGAMWGRGRLGRDPGGGNGFSVVVALVLGLQPPHDVLVVVDVWWSRLRASLFLRSEARTGERTLEPRNVTPRERASVTCGRRSAHLARVRHDPSGRGAGVDQCGRLIPLGLATVLIGFFSMVVRRRPRHRSWVSCSWITLALRRISRDRGVPLLVELGASLDVLLVVVVLRVLAVQLSSKFAVLDLDQLQGLHD